MTTNARELAELATAYAGGNGLSFRNRIINGDMRIDQRNNGASVTPTNGQYLVDRWSARLSQASKFSAQQNAGAVTPPVGFENYLGFTSLSAYTVGASEAFGVRQLIEGFNASDLAWGTASAATVTLSFWVRSSLTGTFGGALVNQSAARSYPFTYSISSANTWEQKTITVAGDTTGTWEKTNGIGIRVNFSIGSGSSASGTAGAWAGADFFSATGATSVVGTNGATFFITGVQLEAGSVATPFERRPYGTELALCQRYYWKNAPLTAATNAGLGNGFQTSAIASSITVFYPVTMRALPTVSFSNLIVSDNTSYDADVSSVGGMFSTTSSSYVGASHSSAGATYRPCNLRAKASGGIGFIDFSAEL
jgi:hypothetical protein